MVTSFDGMPCALGLGMKAKNIDEVVVYQEALRGSASETRTHLRKARRKKFISEAEHTDLSGKYTTIGKRLTRWIHYLEDSDWTNRG